MEQKSRTSPSIRFPHQVWKYLVISRTVMLHTLTSSVTSSHHHRDCYDLFQIQTLTLNSKIFTKQLQRLRHKAALSRSESDMNWSSKRSIKLECTGWRFETQLQCVQWRDGEVSPFYCWTPAPAQCVERKISCAVNLNVAWMCVNIILKQYWVSQSTIFLVLMCKISERNWGPELKAIKSNHSIHKIKKKLKSRIISLQTKCKLLYIKSSVFKTLTSPAHQEENRAKGKKQKN